MIYLGVKLFPNAFKITALSESFAPLGKQYFSPEQYDKFQLWVDSLKYQPHEPVQCFFDEIEFNNHNYQDILFEFDNNDHDIYLVNHQKLLNLLHFLYEWSACELELPMKPEITFLLASAFRIFDDEYIKPVHLDDEPF